MHVRKGIHIALIFPTVTLVKSCLYYRYKWTCDALQIDTEGTGTAVCYLHWVALQTEAKQGKVVAWGRNARHM
jgi:hypothetical protein